MQFPKPGKTKKKPRRDINKEYIAWIHTWDCIVPGCTHKWPVEASHMIPRSRLGADLSALPICAWHHRLHGIHNRGIKTCKKEWGVDFDALIKKFNELFVTGEVGPHPEAISFLEKKIVWRHL